MDPSLLLKGTLRELERIGTGKGGLIRVVESTGLMCATVPDWIMAARRTLGWRPMELRFVILAAFSSVTRSEPMRCGGRESSETLEGGVGSLSSGTGVGGFTGRPLLALRDDSIVNEE